MPVRRQAKPVFWVLAQVGSRIRVGSPRGLDETGGKVLPAPRVLQVPTRHGLVRVVVQEPRQEAMTSPSPVVVHLHGGGFVNRHPEQDLHIARSYAALLDVAVVLPDYETAPKVQYPVAEEEALDVVRWVRAAHDQSWDGARLLLSGVSAGAKLCLNVCQFLYAAGEAPPAAVALVVPVTDVVRTDRTSSKKRPAISPFSQRFVGWAYFPDATRRTETIASPRLDPELSAAMPATLVLTGELDTLAPEGAELADRLREAGVSVTYREFAGVDHDFVAGRDRTIVNEALGELVTFFRNQLRLAEPT